MSVTQGLGGVVSHLKVLVKKKMKKMNFIFQLTSPGLGGLLISELKHLQLKH